MKYLSLMSLFVMALISCHKSSPDTQAPVIQLTAPQNGQVFSAGDSVRVQGVISDNDEIHEVHLYVTDSTTTNLVLHFEEHLDAASWNLDKAFMAQAGITYRIEVDANDHSGNTSEKLIFVKGQ